MIARRVLLFSNKILGFIERYRGQSVYSNINQCKLLVCCLLEMVVSMSSRPFFMSSSVIL